MKKSCKHIDITNPTVIEPFIEECLVRHKRGHSLRRMLTKMFSMTDKEYEKLVSNDDEVILNTAYRLAGIIAGNIKSRNIPEFVPVIFVREDKTTRKVRLIGREPAMQQFYDYVAVRSCEELWRKRFVPQQCSSLPGRGQVYGVEMIRGYIRKDNRQIRYAKAHRLRYTRQCKYFVKLDIRKCYPSTDKAVLMNLLERNIGNPGILYLWKSLLESYGRAVTPDGKPYTGLLIGSLPSQWAAQFLISYIYRYAMNHGGASHMVIFMDDMMLTGPNRRKLKRLVDDIIDYAKDSLHYTIKSTWNIRKLDKCSIDMMGYVVHASGKVSMRTRNFLHARRIFLRMQNGRFGERSARRLVSYKGFFNHSDSNAASKKYNTASCFKKAQKFLGRRGSKENESVLHGKAGEAQI